MQSPISIFPQVAEVRQVKDKKVQPELGFLRGSLQRKNNRKNTRGRKTQYIRCAYGVFPNLIFYTKCIKHKH